MGLELFIGLILILFLMDYMFCIKWLKILRSEDSESRIKQWQLILACLFFGGPALLITYMFPEVRLEDSKHNYSYIICGVVFTILQCAVIYLLIHFGVVKLVTPKA